MDFDETHYPRIIEDFNQIDLPDDMFDGHEDRVPLDHLANDERSDIDASDEMRDAAEDDDYVPSVSDLANALEQLQVSIAGGNAPLDFEDTMPPDETQMIEAPGGAPARTHGAARSSRFTTGSANSAGRSLLQDPVSTLTSRSQGLLSDQDDSRVHDELAPVPLEMNSNELGQDTNTQLALIAGELAWADDGDDDDDDDYWDQPFHEYFDEDY